MDRKKAIKIIDMLSTIGYTNRTGACVRRVKLAVPACFHLEELPWQRIDCA
jgi:hypothetical protein